MEKRTIQLVARSALFPRHTQKLKMFHTNNIVYNLIWIIVRSEVTAGFLLFLIMNFISLHYLLSFTFFVLFLLLHSLQNLLSHWIILAIKPVLHVLFVQRIVRIVRKFMSTENPIMWILPVRAALSSCTTTACIERAELWEISLVEWLLSSQSKQCGVDLGLCIRKIAYRGLVFISNRMKIPSFPFPAYILHDLPFQWASSELAGEPRMYLSPE